MLATLAMVVEVEEVVEEEGVEVQEVVDLGHKALAVAVKTVLMRPLSAQSGAIANVHPTR